MRSLLLIRPRNYSDESIEGYLIRIAQDNGWYEFYRTNNLPYHIKTLMPSTTFLTNNPNYNVLYDIADQLTGYMVDIDKRNNRKYLSRNELLITNHLTRYCPLCLEESRYHRIEWFMYPEVICKKHLVIMSYKCCNCSKPVTVGDIVNNSCAICNYPLTKLKLKMLNESDVILQDRLIKQSYFMSKPIFLGFDSMDYYRLMKWFIHCTATTSKSHKGDFALSHNYSKISNMVTIREIDIDLVSKDILHANLFFNDWPNNFISFVNGLSSGCKVNFIEKFFFEKHFGKMRKINTLENDYKLKEWLRPFKTNK